MKGQFFASVDKQTAIPSVESLRNELPCLLFTSCKKRLNVIVRADCVTHAFAHTVVLEKRIAHQ